MTFLRHIRYQITKRFVTDYRHKDTIIQDSSCYHDIQSRPLAKRASKNPFFAIKYLEKKYSLGKQLEINPHSRPNARKFLARN